MAKLEIKYRLEGKALPPRPIRVAIGGWGGSAERKKENGSQPEPWHCPAFVDGCTHGFELLYQYETECHVVNENGKVSFQWSLENEPGGGRDPRDDFTLSHPLPSTDYLFGTSLDIQVPPGYVLRTEPHPRIFRDETQTVPAAFYGHVQSEWWPKKLFLVFKIPAPGQRHVFRKGEPYALVLCIPRDDYVLTPMTPGEHAYRRKLEDDIKRSRSLIAKRVWISGGNVEFNDHYTVLARAYAREGLAGVEATVREALDRLGQILPQGKSVPQYIELGKQALAEKRFVEAKEILQAVLQLDPGNAEIYRQLAALNWAQNLPRGAVEGMKRAVSLAPNQRDYRMDMASLYRLVNRPDLAEQEVRAALAIDPNYAPARQLLAQLTARPQEGGRSSQENSAAAPQSPHAAAQRNEGRSPE